MHLRRWGHDWQRAIWKVVSNPAVEVLAAIVAVLLAAWLVIQTDMERPKHNPFPLPVCVR